MTGSCITTKLGSTDFTIKTISQLPNLFIASSGTPLQQQVGSVLACKVPTMLCAAQASVTVRCAGSAHELVRQLTNTHLLYNVNCN